MIPADTAAKLAKILPRLASEHDGEILATVRGISRTLAAAGLDWHALAAAIGAPAGPRLFDLSGFADIADEWEAEAAAEKARRSAPDAPAQVWGRKLWGDDMEPWSTVAQRALWLDWSFPKSQGGRILTKDERERLKAWERSGRLTNAEADWLSGIIDRLHAVCEKARQRMHA